MLVERQQAEKDLLTSAVQFLDEQALDTQRALQLFLSRRASEDTAEPMDLDIEDLVIPPNYLADIQQAINDRRLHIQVPDKRSGTQRRARSESVSPFLNFPIALNETVAPQLTTVTPDRKPSAHWEEETPVPVWKRGLLREYAGYGFGSSSSYGIPLSPAPKQPSAVWMTASTGGPPAGPPRQQSTPPLADPTTEPSGGKGAGGESPVGPPPKGKGIAAGGASAAGGGPPDGSDDESDSEPKGRDPKAWKKYFDRESQKRETEKIERM